MKKPMLTAALVAMSGCLAHAPALPLEGSTLAIRRAQDAGAMNVPLAKLHLGRAQQAQELARQLAGRRDGRARTLLVCAEADAELALALADEAKARREAAKARAELAELKWQGGAR